MGACLQCGQQIPVQTILHGESRFCCASHRMAFHDVQQRLGTRLQLLDIPEPGSEWGLPAASALDSNSLAGLMPTPCGVLRIPGGPKVGPLQRLPWKYEMAFPSQPALAEPLWEGKGLRVESLRSCIGKRMVQARLAPLPRRQDRLSRYALVLALLRLNDGLRPNRASLTVKTPIRQKQLPAPLYRSVRGFPIFPVGEGEPALCGFQRHAALQWACRGAFPVRQAPERQEELLPAPAAPAIGIQACLSPDITGWIDTRTPARGLGTLLTKESNEAARALPIASQPRIAPLVHAVAEPWALQASYVPAWKGVSHLAEGYFGGAGQLRDRRSEGGLHVPQSLLLPLRPRLLLSEAAGQPDGGATGRDSGVVSISSLRAAIGSRR